MSVITAIKGMSVAGKIFGAAAPILMMGAALLYHNHAVSTARTDGETAGKASRNLEVAGLKQAAADWEGKFNTADALRIDAEADVVDLKGKAEADAQAHSRALEAQLSQFNAAQAVSANAMKAMAARGAAADKFWADINNQFKGVTYETDPTTGKCRIIGGGRVLRNAAAGK